MQKKTNLIILILSILSLHTFSQISSSIVWNKCYGGIKYDRATNFVQTSDGGILLIGRTSSNDGDVSGNHDPSGIYFDYWVAKLNSQGKVKWQKCFGGSRSDVGNTIIEAPDGGVTLAGTTLSNDGDVSGNHDALGNSADIWIVHLDNNGKILWQRCYGGSGNETVFSHMIIPTQDSGYIFTASTNSNDGDVSGNHDISGSYADIWVVKIQKDGNIQWQKCLGGSSEDNGNSVMQLKNGNYMVAGTSLSVDGDITFNHGAIDAWLVQLSPTGDLIQQNTYGGSYSDGANVLAKTEDGYIFAGYTYSNDGDVSGNHDVTGNTYDEWIVKLSKDGTIRWQKCIGGSLTELAASIEYDKNFGCVIAGSTSSNDGDISNYKGNIDGWVTIVDTAGNLENQLTFGGSAFESFATIKKDLFNRTGFLVIGSTTSNDGDITGNHGSYDILLGRLLITSIQNQKAPPEQDRIQKIAANMKISMNPNPVKNFINLKIPDHFFNSTYSLTISDITGKIVVTKNSIRTQIIKIDLPIMHKGMYVIRTFSDNGNSLSLNFIKE